MSDDDAPNPVEYLAGGDTLIRPTPRESTTE